MGSIPGVQLEPKRLTLMPSDLLHMINWYQVILCMYAKIILRHQNTSYEFEGVISDQFDHFSCSFGEISSCPELHGQVKNS